MVGVLAIAAISIAVAHLWRYASIRLCRRVQWWQIHPTGADVDWQAIRLAFARTKKRWFPGRVLIARIGSAEGDPTIWIGISGAQEPDRVAEVLATALAARLGKPQLPPFQLRHGFSWRVGYTEPLPREPDAATSRERVLDEALTPEQPIFPDVCDESIDHDDSFLVICQQGTKPTRIIIMVLTTIHGVDTSITDAAEMRRSFMGLSFALIATAVAVAAFGLPFLPNSAVSLTPAFIAAGSVVGLWALWFAWRTIKTPAPLAALAQNRAPRLTKAAAKGTQLPVWQVGEWGAGSSRTGTHSPMRAAPAEAKVRAGARLGVDPNGDECWLPYSDRYRGVIAYGDPGTGKTTFLLNLLRADAQRRAEGEPLTIIWIESKGEGAQRAERVMLDTGTTPLVLSGASVSTPRLELLDRSNPAGAGRLLTEAMRYAYSVGDIYEQSAELLAAAFHAAIAFPPEGCAELGLPHGQANVIEVAFRLVGGIPEQHSKAKQALRRHLPEEHRQALERYFAESARDFGHRVEPVRNKLSALRAATGLFEPLDDEGIQRPQITFERALDAAAPIIIQLGAPAHIADSTYTEIIAQRTAAMVMFVLWESIKKHCDSWQAAGRMTAIYSDELRDIAGFGDHQLEVVRALADQGRSRGVLPTFGTQRPDQLNEATRLAVNSFGSQAYFALRATEAATEASLNLKESYTPEEITALAKFHCATSITHTGFVPAAFTLLPDNL